MALQINALLTTNSGLAVPSGSYCWLQADFGNDFKYRVRAKMIFFKSKADFDAGKSRFDPVEVQTDLLNKMYTPAQIGAIDYLAIHQEVKAWLENIPQIGVGNVAIVQ